MSLVGIRNGIRDAKPYQLSGEQANDDGMLNLYHIILYVCVCMCVCASTLPFHPNIKSSSNDFISLVAFSNAPDKDSARMCLWNSHMKTSSVAGTKKSVAYRTYSPRRERQAHGQYGCWRRRERCVASLSFI